MSTSPVRDVTPENFVSLGKAFIGARGGAGFIIALRPYPGTIFDDDNPFKPTPRQWGAWMAYWARLPYKTKAMQDRGYATTPAEWPSDFDAQATFQGDQAAADACEARWHNERESRAFHAGGLIKASSKALESWRYERARIGKPVPESHPAPAAGHVIDVSDFPPTNASRAELKAWEARQKAEEAA